MSWVRFLSLCSGEISVVQPQENRKLKKNKQPRLGMHERAITAVTVSLTSSQRVKEWMAWDE
jgi:hypothetical protein